MRSLEKKVADLTWIYEYRLLKRRKAEQDAQGFVKEAATSARRHEVAEEASATAQDECLRLAEAGKSFDLDLAQLWWAELRRCDRQELTTRRELEEANDAVAIAKAAWSRALLIAESAEQELSSGRRKLNQAKEQWRLNLSEDLVVQKVNRS